MTKGRTQAPSVSFVPLEIEWEERSCGQKVLYPTDRRERSRSGAVHWGSIRAATGSAAAPPAGNAAAGTGHPAELQAGCRGAAQAAGGRRRADVSPYL